MRTFTPPAGRSTRLSRDVWELLCTHAAQNGNSSTREALEQLIRQTLGTGHQPTSESAITAPDRTIAPLYLKTRLKTQPLR